MRVDRPQALLFGLVLGDALAHQSTFSETDAADQFTIRPHLQTTLAWFEALVKADDGTSIDDLISAPSALVDPDADAAQALLQSMLIGCLYAHRPERLRQAIAGILPWSASETFAAGLAVAYLTQLALNESPPNDHLRRVFEFVSGLSEDFDAALRRVGHVLGWANEAAALKHIGLGSAAGQAAALALYCVMRRADDYAAGVRLAASISAGDGLIAGLAGGVLGAQLGLDAIPMMWRQRCENADDLADLSRQLRRVWSDTR